MVSNYFCELVFFFFVFGFSMATIAMRTHTGHYRHHQSATNVATDTAITATTNEFIHFVTSKFIYFHNCFLLLLMLFAFQCEFQFNAADSSLSSLNLSLFLSLPPSISRAHTFYFLFLFHSAMQRVHNFVLYPIHVLVFILPLHSLHFSSLHASICILQNILFCVYISV